MSLSGSLKTMVLGDLLQWCGSNLKTGTLRIKRGPIEKALFFKDGRLFSSMSSSPRETLGQFLIRAGKITEEELFTALIQQDTTKEPLGQILIGAELITESELEELLRVKTEESIYDCFLWMEGSFAFDDNVLPEKIPVFLPLELTGVILEGARRTDEWERIHEAFPSRLSTFRVKQDAVDAAGELRDEAHRILDLVERGKSMAEISLELHAVEFYAASRLLELHGLGLIEVHETPEEMDFDQQVEELKVQLEKGVAAYNDGDYEEAGAAFGEALELDPQNKYARLFQLKLKKVFEDLEKVAEIPLEAVPRLKLTVVELSQLALDPQDGFVLSRVNGEWDIDSIIKICPMNRQEVLIIFNRLIDQNLIELADEA